MRRAVLKFGGTCLASEGTRRLVLEHIRKKVEKGFKCVVVVSAMGRKGDPYATDTLESLLEGESQQSGPKSSIDAREKDLALSCGEIISMTVLSTMARAAGMSAKGLTGWEAGIITENVHCNASILEIEKNALEKALLENEVVVVAGFQGISRSGEITCLGRGGSDTTAVALAGALDADEVEIVKEIEGIYTANPDKIKKAENLRILSAEEIRQMAWQGAKALHPRAAELVEKFKIPVIIRSLFNPSGSTTDILPSVKIEPSRIITAVSENGPVSRFHVSLQDVKDPQGRIVQLFQKIADEKISMDMFNVFKNEAYFSVEASVACAVADLIGAESLRYDIIEPCMKVSIIGAGMHGRPGIMAEFCRIIHSKGIDILQTADSHAVISALVKKQDAQRASEVLHEAFIESDNFSLLK